MTLEQALEFQEDGWAVIPLRLDKTPWLPKGEQDKYLQQAATEDEIKDFWKRFPNANVGLACGKVSGRTVIDIDEGEDVFPDTRTVQTPTGGKHKIYLYTASVGNSVSSYYKGIDTRNDKGYIVAAGSHCEYTKKGKKIVGEYIVIDEIPSRPFPEALFMTKRQEGEGFDPSKLLGAGEGSRNDTAASMIGFLVQGKPKEIQVALWEFTKSWNAQCKPPLPEQELLAIFNSITAREWSKPKEDIKLVEGLKITKRNRDYVVEIPLPSGRVYLKFSEIIRSRQSFDVVLTIQLRLEKEGLLPAFEQRIDLNSASAVRNLATDLNSAYGNKKDGYNWVMILNKAAIAIKKNINQEKKPVILAHDSPYIKSTYLVEHFIEEGSSTLIHGDGSTGKSYLCLYMAVCSALRRDFFGKKTTYFKTLYIDMESTSSKLNNRLHRIANDLQVPFSFLADHIHWYKPEGSLVSEQEIIAGFVENTYGMIIIDAGAAATGGSPMDEQSVLRMFSSLEQIPCAKLIIHHEPKNVAGVGDDKAYYGTTFWRNAPRLAWRLKRLQKDGAKSVIQAVHHKANDDTESAPITYSMSFSASDAFVPTTNFTVLDDFELNDDEKILNYLVENGEAEEKVIVAKLNLSRPTTQRRIEELMKKGKIERKKVGHKYLYYVEATISL